MRRLVVHQPHGTRVCRALITLIFNVKNKIQQQQQQNLQIQASWFNLTGIVEPIVTSSSKLLETCRVWCHCCLLEAWVYRLMAARRSAPSEDPQVEGRASGWMRWRHTSEYIAPVVYYESISDIWQRYCSLYSYMCTPNDMNVNEWIIADLSQKPTGLAPHPFRPRDLRCHLYLLFAGSPHGDNWTLWANAHCCHRYVTPLWWQI